MSIRLHLLVSVGLVLLLVIAAAGGMLHVTIAQSQAAAQIDVAARQQALAQRVATQALAYARSKKPDDAARLEAALAQFEKSATALTSGGKAVMADGGEREIPALEDVQALGLARKEVELWGPMKDACQKVVKSEGSDLAAVERVVGANTEVEAVAGALFARLMSVGSSTLGRLEVIEGVVITLGVLAGIVALEIGRRITNAVVLLTEKSDAVSQGQVDLAIDVPGPAEIGRLGKSLDRMRISLKKSMEMLQKRQAGG
jgi:HAMP domain-containing protein